MPKFKYKAKRGPDTGVEGELTAETYNSAVAKLDAMGLSPIWVREEGHEDYNAPVSGLANVRGVKQKDVTVFTRQLASLVKSGVPILKALNTISNQSANPAMRRLVEYIEQTVRDGNMLSDALRKYPTLFPEIYVNMVYSGESAGLLDKMLFRLALAREHEEEVRRKVQAAMAYPTLVIVVGVVTVFVLLTFFMPKIVVLFKDLKNLPLPTRMLMAVSDILSKAWYWVVGAVVFTSLLFKRAAANERGRFIIDSMKLNIPFIGSFILKRDISRFARTMALLIDAGINVDKAIKLSAGTLFNTVIRKEIMNAAEMTITQGMPFSTALRHIKFLPPLVANMSAVGEEGGKLDEALDEIASFYEAEIDQQSKIATSLIEPILILVVGLIVGFIVTAMLMPIFKLSTSF